MTLAARGVGRLVGVEGFRWFSAERSTATWWRVLVIRLAAVAAPWCFSVALFAAHFALSGVTVPREGAYVAVLLPGPAERAGMQDGDHVLRVGEREVHSWNEMRAAVKEQAGPVELEVERRGSRQVLRVTPREGKLGVVLQNETKTLGVAEVARRAVESPGAVVRAWAQSVWKAASQDAEGPEVGGPVRIIKEVDENRLGALLFLVATRCAYVWPLLVGVVLFELATGAIFHATYPEAASSSARGYRLAGLHQAVLLSASAYVAVVPTVLLAPLELPGALLLTVLILPAFVSGYALIWVAGSEVWRRPYALVCL